MAESVNRNITYQKTVCIDARDYDAARRPGPGIVVVKYHAAAAADDDDDDLVHSDAPHALLLSTANTSGNSLFYGGCALVREPVGSSSAVGGVLSDVLYTTSNLLQTTDSAQLPVVLITRVFLRREDDNNDNDNDNNSRITSVHWTKLRAPPQMPTPAAVIPFSENNGNDGVLYCAQGNMAPRSSGLFFMPRGRRPRAVVDSYYGRDFNSVRDVAVHPGGAGGDSGGDAGSLWFTDPCTGYEHDLRPEPRLPCHVYRAGVGGGDLRAMADGLVRPTSLCFSPDGRVLYVSDVHNTNAEQGTIYAYDVVSRDDGDFLVNRRVFAHAVRGAPLCIRCDNAGNVFAACGSGVEIWSAGGSLRAVLDVPGGGGVSSLCFTTARCDTLLLCAGQQLWWVQLRGQSE